MRALSLEQHPFQWAGDSRRGGRLQIDADHGVSFVRPDDRELGRLGAADEVRGKMRTGDKVPGSLRADLLLEGPQQLKRPAQRTRFELARGGELAESVKLGIGGAEAVEAFTGLGQIEG